jgi:Xaa-Pro aminopeptidase
MRQAGFRDYDRGHFGHGVGQNVFCEEWPFISADAELPLEPGMVLAFETPYYVTGIGGFIVEDLMLITEQGHESMNRLPYELRELS